MNDSCLFSPLAQKGFNTKEMCAIGSGNTTNKDAESVASLRKVQGTESGRIALAFLLDSVPRKMSRNETQLECNCNPAGPRSLNHFSG